VPIHNQYFEKPNIGGSDAFLDYCPVILPRVNGDCRNPANQPYGDEKYSEKYGKSSRCIEGTFSPYGYYPILHGGCYEVTCRGDGFDITIGTNTIACGKNVHPEPNNTAEGLEGFGG
jgi:hypothetical protein